MAVTNYYVTFSHLWLLVHQHLVGFRNEGLYNISGSCWQIVRQIFFVIRANFVVFMFVN